MIDIKRLGHVAFTVIDVEETASFYEKILGMEISDRAGEAVFLRCNDDHHCLALYPGEKRGLHHLGLEVNDKETLQAAREELSSHGHEPIKRDFEEPGHGEAICYRDPDGFLLELYEGMESIKKTLPPNDVQPVKFGHITYMSKDLKTSLAFYTELLGFRISDTLEDNSLAWIRCNQEHHGIAIINAGVSKVNHYCFDLADWSVFKQICDLLLDNNIPIIYGPSRHGPGGNLFLYIPDAAGNVIELSTEMILVKDEESYQPLAWKNEPKTVDVWRGIPAPSHFMHGEGREFNDWSSGSPVLGSGWNLFNVDGKDLLDPTAKITAPTHELPEFKIEIPRFTLGQDNPLDHVKAMVITDRHFPTCDGLTVSVELAVDTHGTESNPFGADPEDPRLANGAIALIDDASGTVLNFEISNRRVLTLRERFAVNAPGGPGLVFPLADPILTDLEIEPGSWHCYEIIYTPGDDDWFNPGSDCATWLIDGKIVHEVSWITTKDSPIAPIIKPAKFRVAMAIFTLLDDLPDGRGGTIPGLDPNYKQNLFGQGATARWRNLRVLNSVQSRHVRK